MSQKVINRIIRIGRKRGESRKHILAALATGRVESNFQNLRYGDADSRGWRQERASLYKNPNNLRASINRFYDETDQLDHGQSAGRLAADVQRPAAQYRGRYSQVMGEARQILRRGGGSPDAGTFTPGTPGTPASRRFVPGVDNSLTRRQLKLDYLNNSHDPDALLNLAYGLANARDTPSSTVNVPGIPGTPGSYSSGKVKAPGKLADIAAEANLIDVAHVPYEWGGGHKGKELHGSRVTPLDCSGAVSRVLGINPRVASQFMSWGKAGRGKKVTIYAKGDHVLMEINGRFWGTSGSNPGGGAGWIPRKAISKSYLSQFTARHPPGL